MAKAAYEKLAMETDVWRTHAKHCQEAADASARKAENVAQRLANKVDGVRGFNASNSNCTLICRSIRSRSPRSSLYEC